MRSWLTEIDEVGLKVFWWKNAVADPESYVSMFCAIPGSKQGRKTMLERTASILLDSVESFALYERKSIIKGQAFTRFYVPVIVTTADLMVSSFEPNAVSLEDGSLPDDALFEAVPFVRFRKSFGDIPFDGTVPPVDQAYSESERTVFVVNAENWETFLNQWELTDFI